jgi:Peptidase C39 family
MMERIVAIITLFVTLVAGGSVTLWAESNKEAKYPQVCGPRCVLAVLEDYGHQEDLLSLVSEMQNGRPEDGCSMHDIEVALQKRNVHCCLTKSGPLDFPSWPSPVIIHLKGGHFAVLEKTQGLYALIRDGTNMQSAWQFIPSLMRRESGNVLFTSRAEITNDAPTFIKWPRLIVGFCSVVLVGLALGMIRRERFRQLLFRICPKSVKAQQEIL